MNVNFKYELNQRVETPFGVTGIISMCAVDRGGNAYYVKTKNRSDWFNEEDLNPADEPQQQKEAISTN